MAISPARIVAFDILLRVDRQDAYASELLHASDYAELSSLDHGLATELVLGVLRWRSLLDDQIAARSSLKLSKLDPEVLTCLRLAAYQLLYLDRVPQHAAVHESVELVKRARKRSAVPFVNAVLRKFAGRTVGSPPTVGEAATEAELAASSAHPQLLVERWTRTFGLPTAQQICNYDQQIPATMVSLRDSEVVSELESHSVNLAPGSLLVSARRVITGDLTRTQAFREGRVAIQDEASQLVALLVGKGSRILDCCAAPGGKTRLLAERNPEATIVAVELHPHRARLLHKLVPARNVQIITADICALPTVELFDRVLVDVPCSGTGTLARNPEIKWRLKPEDLLDLRSRQLAILQAAMQRVAPGGRLVYSTCSLEPEENQNVVESALSADSSFRPVDSREELWQLHSHGELAVNDIESLTWGSYLRTIPGVHPCDGFFAAILQKV
ncbi:MAG TPA: 16S rRNA (cytosine(967)-C(5))-methyltransferase RsmB [Terriglobales bacterium]|jgi:16S rRNA (cytosine967-C5)-methyltransferase|nr:16S rRNA (cytosine(967)-C(5))-methyltransferase RsmB [Terriglobales bacterium]